MTNYTADDYVNFIELGRKDKLSPHGLDMIAVKYREMQCKLETLAQQPLSGSAETASPKSCRNCGREEYCDYSMGECIGLDCIPKKWIPA